VNPVELEIHRRNTVAFIAADGVDLVLQPQSRVMTDAGGYKYVLDAPRSPQVFRLIPLSIAGNAPELKTSTGRMVSPAYVILGAHDAAMERWDQFEFQNVWYEIVSPIRPEYSTNVYERKADVVRREAV
jgi:hypothetical protein